MGIIGSIRKHSWVAVLLVGVAIIAFIIGDFTKGNRTPDFAKINNTTITYRYFDEQVEQEEAVEQVSYEQQYGTTHHFTSDEEQRIRENIWSRIYQNALTAPEFKALGLTVTNAELSAMFSGAIEDPFVMQNLADPNTGKINAAQIKQYTDNFDQLDTNTRIQWKNFEKAASENRLYTKYNALIARGFYTPKAIAKKVAELESHVADIRVVSLPLSTIKDEEVSLTDKDYQSYYDQHKAEFFQFEESREVRYVLFPVVPTQEDLAAIQTEVEKVYTEFESTPDAEVPFFVKSEQCVYDSNYVKASQLPAPLDTLVAKTGKGGFITPRQVGNNWVMGKVLDVAQRPDSLRIGIVFVLNDKAGQASITRSDDQAKMRADSVADMLRANKISIAEAMNQYSDVHQGADTNWMPDGAFGIFNEKILSTPVNGVFTMADPRNVGHYVIKVMGKTTPNTKYRVAAITREIVPSSNTSRDVYNVATSFATNNRTFQAMMDGAAQQNLNVNAAQCQMMQYDLDSRVKGAREIVRWAYDEKTEVGAVADQVFQIEDAYIVAALKDIYKKGTLPLEQIKDDAAFENLVRLEKKKDMLAERAEKAKNADINKVAATLGTTVDTIASVSGGATYLDKFGMELKLIGAVSAAPKGKMLGPVKDASGVYMVQVDNVVAKPVTEAEEAVVASRMARIAQQKSNDLMRNLIKKAKIKDQRNLYL